ncbi:hypothetical protein PMAL9190_02280 [Photobacterium malacitanum]|uniref:Lcl C-terminal domain-containing protein n=1 Tax=Photobacterium malacitanum TaxID=2204294 RepID=A0A1Y6MI66_9GAMM|nr:DUF1566 domain-containing protein [Photobacterium malacitanum]SMY36246.1 hypothetical protein PMAL9190_02280 [Photobacterium malacitanum]
MKLTNKMLILVIAIFANSVYAAPDQICLQGVPLSAPNSRYIMNNNGTVKDIKTGLTWMRCLVGMHWDATENSCTGEPMVNSWQSALMTVKNINSPLSSHYLRQFAGIKHWRLPNIKELQSLQETSCYIPAVNRIAFPNSVKDAYSVAGTVWSATPSMIADEAYIFGLSDGLIFKQGGNAATYSSLLVAE